MTVKNSKEKLFGSCIFMNVGAIDAMVMPPEKSGISEYSPSFGVGT